MTNPTILSAEDLKRTLDLFRVEEGKPKSEVSVVPHVSRESTLQTAKEGLLTLFRD